MNHSELLSKAISFLRFPLTVLVVFIHFNLSVGLTIRGDEHGLDNPDWYFVIIHLISDGLARIAVPLFFVISGFLFFNGKDFNLKIYQEKLKSRFWSLFVPFILWNIIAIFWKMKYFIPIISSFYRPVNMQLTLPRIFNTFFINNNNGIFIGPQEIDSITGLGFPIDIPLWYVRDLMLMVLFSPFIIWMIKEFRYTFSIGLGLVWFLSPLFIHTINGNDELFTALFFFSVGATYSVNKKNILVSFSKWKFAPFFYLLIVIADSLTKGKEYNNYLHNLGILVGVVSAVIVASSIIKLGKGKVIIALADTSFFIFALHFLFINDVGKFAFVIFHVPDNNPYAMLILYFTVPIFSILVCLGLYWILNRFFPRICSLLTGGR